MAEKTDTTTTPEPTKQELEQTLAVKDATLRLAILSNEIESRLARVDVPVDPKSLKR